MEGKASLHWGHMVISRLGSWAGALLEEGEEGEEGVLEEWEERAAAREEREEAVGAGMRVTPALGLSHLLPLIFTVWNMPSSV